MDKMNPQLLYSQRSNLRLGGGALISHMYDGDTSQKKLANYFNPR